MLALYPKKIRDLLLLSLVLVAVIIVLFLRSTDSNPWFWGFIAVLGLLAIFAVASNSAVSEHTAELSRLYDKLDADGFVRDYSWHLTQKLPFQDTRLMVRMHLSNAYVALGEFDKATEVLTSFQLKDKKKEEGTLLNRFAVMSNLCYCAEQEGDTKKARAYLDELLLLKSMLEKLQEAKPINRKMVFSTDLNEQCMAYLTTGKADVEALKRQVRMNQQILPKITTCLWLARAYLGEGQREEAEKLLKRIVELAPDLYPGRQAKKLLDDPLDGAKG